MTSEGKVQVQQDGYDDPNVAHAVAPKKGFQLPDGYQDIIHTRTEINFSWRDRIRILFSGVCWVDIDTYTENLPGKVKSKSEVIVPHSFRGWSPSHYMTLSASPVATPSAT